MKVEHRILQQFIADILLAAGVDSQEAPLIAHTFVWFDLIGRDTQGVSRLPAYLKRLAHGLITSPSHPEFNQKSDTIYLVDGHHGFGHYLGHVAMLKAIDVATKHGVGLVGVRQSNHFGAAAYYVQLAAQSCQIGLAWSNSVPHVAPYGGVTPTLGTNPFAFGAPVRDGHSVLVDFSTGASAGSVLAKAASENQPIPQGVMIDTDGNPITNPQDVAKGVLLPFGGAKGFCLGLVIEILSGVVTGAAISHEIASLHNDFSKNSSIGHLFIAIDVAKLMPIENYFARMDLLVSFIKGAKKQKGVDEILLPGETRWRNYSRQLKYGIDLELRAVQSLTDMAKNFALSTPW